MKKLARLAVVGLVILILTFTSCGDTPILNLIEADSHSVDVKSVSDGGILIEGEPLVFSVYCPANEEAPNRLDITVTDSQGAEVASQSIDDPQIDEDLTLEFPDMETGRYTIDFVLYGKESVLLEESLVFFYTKGSYTIKGIESFPPVIVPGSTVLLKANLQTPEDSDPYLTWRQNQLVLAQGTVQDGLTYYYWTAPEENGVYSISLELFPFPPPAGSFYRFTSSSIMMTELYISSEKGLPKNDFSPRASYYSLYHLSGNLSDVGGVYPETGLADAEEIGYLEPAANEDILGYRFDSSSGFRIPRFILPLEYGNLKPFTLSLGISVESATQGARILKTASEQEQFSLELNLDAGLTPAAVLEIGSQRFQLASGPAGLEKGKRYVLSFSIRPQPDSNSFFAAWALDGSITATHQISAAPIVISNRGETVVGGDGGFAGVLDELGVFYRDEEGQYTTDPTLE